MIRRRLGDINIEPTITDTNSDTRPTPCMSLCVIARPISLLPTQPQDVVIEVLKGIAGADYVRAGVIDAAQSGFKLGEMVTRNEQSCCHGCPNDITKKRDSYAAVGHELWPHLMVLPQTPRLLRYTTGADVCLSLETT